MDIAFADNIPDNTPLSKFKELGSRMFETNATYNNIKEMRERSDALRGYL